MIPSLTRGCAASDGFTPTGANADRGSTAGFAMNRNVLSVAVGALAVCVVILGYKVYQDNKQPKGVQITVGQNGLSVEKK